MRSKALILLPLLFLLAFWAAPTLAQPPTGAEHPSPPLLMDGKGVPAIREGLTGVMEGSLRAEPQAAPPNMTKTILLTLAGVGGVGILGLGLYFLRQRLAEPGFPPTGLGHPPSPGSQHEH